MGRSPGQRFRFEQYLPYLRENGFTCHVSYLIDEKDDTIFYAQGRYLAKLRFLLKSLRHRQKDMQHLGDFDMVFLYREAHMLGTTFFERKIKKAGVKMLVDFDDSIWLKDVSNGNKRLAFLKRPSKTADIVRLSDACIVGNRFLAEYAGRFNPGIHIIPTTIDTEQYQATDVKRERKGICIGWTGSSTTIKHFSLAVPVLKRLKEKYGDRIWFRVISDEFYDGALDGLENVKWSRESELEDLSVIDIGIMPLPNDEWSRGKCGFKGLQYMALGKPAVMSPVGVNKEIIRHEENGYLADTPEEWEQTLIRLIEDADLRRRIGQAGRKTVVERFSYQSQKDRYLKIFRDLLKT